MKRKTVHRPLSLADFVNETVSLTERVLTKEELEARPGPGATAWRTSTPVMADLAASFMKAEKEEVAGFDFTAEDIEADKERINDLQRGRAAVEESGSAIDRAMSATKDRLAGRLGELQGFVQRRAVGGPPRFRANAAPLLTFSAKQTDKQAGRRRETTELRTTIDQISAERDLATRLGRGDKLTVEDLRPLAPRTTRRTPRKKK
jgi:hypothetical protein